MLISAKQKKLETWKLFLWKEQLILRNMTYHTILLIENSNQFFSLICQY